MLKSEAITEKNLVLGIDVRIETYYARAFESREALLLYKVGLHKVRKPWFFNKNT